MDTILILRLLLIVTAMTLAVVMPLMVMFWRDSEFWKSLYDELAECSERTIEVNRSLIETCKANLALSQEVLARNKQLIEANRDLIGMLRQEGQKAD